MKRYSGLHDKLCTIENIEVADDNARKNKFCWLCILSYSYSN